MKKWFGDTEWTKLIYYGKKYKKLKLRSIKMEVKLGMLAGDKKKKKKKKKRRRKDESSTSESESVTFDSD